MPSTSHVVLALFCCGLAGVPEAVAQQTTIPDNTRLRLTLTQQANAPPRHVIGWFESLDRSGITLRDRRGRVSTTQRTKVNRIERSQGRHSRWRRTGFGFLIGATSGALVGALSGDDCSRAGGSFAPCFSAGTTAGLLGVFFGGIGAGVGAALPPGERWELLALPSVPVTSGR
jgi:hypothetical protein